ncbi:CPXCG motif-containing cysteine-rich protein [Methylomarinum vadi]|uniref:CPXCG motif-containing cysteine-rich protein n=1 Tax=Methylomarinum vadi TaxID=438855 RepID=UPI0004DF93AD|nr:CPXCG motif-containing cysteine-rich protein [Methylomarinum vadi]
MPQLQERLICCPYCGEFITVLIDSSSGEQQYYEDCQVCCAPILFDLVINHDENFSLIVRREDE